MPSTLIVDDDTDIRSLVRMVIERANDGLEVVGEAADGYEALRLWADCQPDAVVLDQEMPGMSGMEVARIILSERPEQTIIMFTAHTGSPELGSAVESGVRAVLDKQQWSSLVDTIRSHLR